MNVGNIVADNDITEENFIIYSDLEEIDNDLPVLIVGWEKTKELFGDDVSILHKQITKNIFWTFAEKERKVDFEVDMISFKQLCYKSFGENIPYVYLDILHGKRHINKKIINKIYTLKDTISYIGKNNMLYILGENIVFGVDLNITTMIGVEKEKIIDRIKKIPNSILLGNEIFNKCKGFINKIDNREKMVPYVYKNGKYE